MITIEELKKKNSFIVEDWIEVSVTHNEQGQPIKTGGRKSCEYEFGFVGNDLYITGDVFGKEHYFVLNQLEVLFNIAKEHLIVTVKINGLDLEIHCPVLRLINE